MRSLKLIVPLAMTCLAAACVDLEVTNPNQRTTDTFWQNEDDALAGLNAAYGGIQANGVYGRWHHFVSDARTDIGTSRSPWTDLQNWTRTVLVTPDFGPNQDVWREHYHAIFRVNQVISNVPEIEMDDALKRRIVAEATFLRALLHYNLANFFGNVPIITEPMDPGEFPASSAQAEVLARVEADALAAAADLPLTYSGGDVGRATKGAALALAARAQLQQREWATAAATFRQVVESGVYELAPTFAENFTMAGDNNSESVFEAQFGGPDVLASGTRGLNIAKMVGPPTIGFTDVQPTEWYFQQFFVENGTADPRLDATIFWNRPGGMDVHGVPFAVRYPTGFKDTGIDKSYFWKKFGEYWLPAQDWDAALNYKVIRYADVLLMFAEALNEAGQTAEAATYLNMVRDRVDLPAVSSTLSQAEMRARIEHEMLMELGWENKRLAYLKWHDMFRKATMQPHDPDFDFFVDGKSELLPIPQSEVDLNPNVAQNPGW
ncbi:MAG TPA: RagB/SusD family nutrient uptake outer membrane protein [Longimicrobiaceae bacterium]